MAQEEGAFPVEIVGFGVNGFEAFGSDQFLESLLHAFLVVLFSEPLDGVHEVGRNPMIHQLIHKRPTGKKQSLLRKEVTIL